MKIKLIWFLATALAVLILSGQALQAEPSAPSSWLAAVVETNDRPVPYTLLRTSALDFIVYHDGTAVWPDRSRLKNDERIDPETWRVGTVSPEALKRFIAVAQANRLLTIEPHPVALGPSGFSGPIGADFGTTCVAVQVGGKKRVIEEYGLSADHTGSDEAYLKAIRATSAAILALRPAKSTAYKPTSIRVGVFYSPDFPNLPPAGIPWPLTAPLTLSNGNQWLTFSGALAQTVIETLARSTDVTSSGQHYHVVWLPNIDIPTDTPAR